jgi:2-keto-3-deoxy-L-rhamnonate aldolase RhmA
LLAHKEKSRLLRQLLQDTQSGGRPVGLGIGLHCVPLIEVAPDFGFRWVLIDAEHTGVDRALLKQLVRAAEATLLPFFVKLNAMDSLEARDALDLGAYGVMVPFTDSPDQLRSFIDEIRFPPIGVRGFCSMARATRFATASYSGQRDEVREMVRFSNEDALVIPSIETPEAIEALDDLLAIPNTPIWHFGLEDLAILLGSENNPDFDLAGRAGLAVSQRLAKAGRRLCTFFDPSTTPESIEAWGADLPYMVDSDAAAFGLRRAVDLVTASVKKR